MVSAVSVRPFVPPPVASAVGNARGTQSVQQAPKTVARSETGGGPGARRITTTPEFVQLMMKNPGLRPASYGDFAKSIRSAGGKPPPAYPGGAYFRVVGGSDAGKIVDISKEKYPGKFMSKSMKIDMMEHGFGRLDLKKMGEVTFDEFAKAHTAFLKSAASGSNTGEMRVNRTAYEALGDKAFPNGPAKNVEYPTNPRTIEELHPWLQGEIRNGRMTLEKAIEITEATARRATMRAGMPQPMTPGPPLPPVPPQEYSRGGGETCITRASIIDRRTRNANGEDQISTVAYANTDGQSAITRENNTRSTTRITILDPQTRLPIVVRDGGFGVRAEAEIVKPRGQLTPLGKPPVIATGQCFFNDGRVVPSTQGPLMNTERPHPDPALPPGSVRRPN